MKLQNKGVVGNSPCLRCGKTLRADYNGICMDCADELGISEFSKDKTRKQIQDIVMKDVKIHRWHFFDLFTNVKKEDIILVLMGLRTRRKRKRGRKRKQTSP
jgi:hypothetical protein